MWSSSGELPLYLIKPASQEQNPPVVSASATTAAAVRASAASINFQAAVPGAGAPPARGRVRPLDRPSERRAVDAAASVPMILSAAAAPAAVRPDSHGPVTAAYPIGSAKPAAVNVAAARCRNARYVRARNPQGHDRGGDEREASGTAFGGDHRSGAGRGQRRPHHIPAVTVSVRATHRASQSGSNGPVSAAPGPMPPIRRASGRNARPPSAAAGAGCDSA